MMEIAVPKGMKALYMDELQAGSGHEVEMLLPRSTRLRIISKNYTDGVYWIKAVIKNE